jgi:D-sedoheptulose 7-phosphate isomerase
MNLQELTNIVETFTKKDLNKLKYEIELSNEIFIIGNGGSNSIASHMAVDYSKFLNKRCFVPNASDLITMMVNDYGYDEMYSKFLTSNFNSSIKSLAILISSSGNSNNILEAAKTCDTLKIPMIILSGFEENNKLNSYKSDSVRMKLWINSKSYGVVEMSHHIFLHAII